MQITVEEADKYQPRFDDKWFEDSAGCHLWTGMRRSEGAGMFFFRGRQVAAARIAWLLRHGAIPDDLQVFHTCEVNHCVNVAHLELGTVRDRLSARPHVQTNPTWETVRKIRRLRAEDPATYTYRKLKEMTGLSIPCIKGICIGQTWKE